MRDLSSQASLIDGMTPYTSHIEAEKLLEEPQIQSFNLEDYSNIRTAEGIISKYFETCGIGVDKNIALNNISRYKELHHITVLKKEHIIDVTKFIIERGKGYLSDVQKNAVQDMFKIVKNLDDNFDSADASSFFENF